MTVRTAPYPLGLRVEDHAQSGGELSRLLAVDKQAFPGGHGSGGEYYQRRMRDFFVRHLQGVAPPNNNGTAETPAGS